MQWSILFGLSLLCLWSGDQAAAADTTTKIPVEIYYETLNGRVRTFFVEQLRPVVMEDALWDKINLKLIPYGNTKQVGKDYQCPFEGVQCEANRLHACVLKQEPEGSLGVSRDIGHFALCFFKNRRAQSSLYDLAKSCLKSGWDDVVACDRNLARDVSAPHKEATEKIAKAELADGLAIRIKADVNSKAEADLFGEICKSLEGSAPTVCIGYEQTPKVTLDIYYEAGDVASGEYFRKQLGPYYHALEDFVTLDVIPYGRTVNTGEGSYTCETEVKCISNKFQAIIAHKYTGEVNGDLVSGPQRLVNFVACLAERAKSVPNAISLLEVCSDAHLEVDTFVDTYVSIKANEQIVIDAMKAMQAKTEKYGKLERLPTVVINGKTDWNGLNDLVGEVCSLIDDSDDNEGTTLGTTPSTESTTTTTESTTTTTESTTTTTTEPSSTTTNPTPTEVSQKSHRHKRALPQICTKVKVAVLYESLHHKSRLAFLETVTPIFHHLYNLVDFEFVPSGRAVEKPGEGVACANGNEQCEANVLALCAIDEFWNDGANYTDAVHEEVFEFLWCVAKNKRDTGVFQTVEYCADNHISGLDVYTQLRNCFTANEGQALAHLAVQRTQSLATENTDLNNTEIAYPAFVINENELFLDNSNHTQLIEKICAKYDEYHSPQFCLGERPAKVDVSVYYDTLSYGADLFFSRQLPWYMYLEEMINLHLYPAGNEDGHADVAKGECASYEPNSTCAANKIQALVIDMYLEHDDDGDAVDGSHRTISFLRCLFSQPNLHEDVLAVGKDCADQHLSNDIWNDIMVELVADQSVYAKALKVTKDLKEALNVSQLQLTPWVTLGADSITHSKSAADDLLRTVCNRYEGADKPDECVPVQVDIYYQALSPLSRRYFLDQVFTTFWHLRDRIQLSLIPYGEAKASSNVTEECAEHQARCETNMHHACAVKLFFGEDRLDNLIEWDGTNQTLSYIHCMLKNIGDHGVSELSEICANQHFIMADEVKECAVINEHGDGLKYLEQMREQTLALYKDASGPLTVVVNGEISVEAVEDLQAVVCAQMIGDKPEECYVPTPAKVNVQFHYSGRDRATQKYVLNELYPNYRQLEEIVNLDIVPYGLMELEENDDGSYKLNCPDGEDECHANVVHACVLDKFWNDDLINEAEFDGRLQTINFLKCYFGHKNYPGQLTNIAAECVEDIFSIDEWFEIHACARNNSLVKFLVEEQRMKVEALVPSLSYQPWITLNNRHSYALEHHFVRAVCDAYKGGEKVPACNQPAAEDAKPIVVLHYEPKNAKSRDFFTNQFNLTLSHINQIGDVVPVPFGRATVDQDEFSCPGEEDCHHSRLHACAMNLLLASHREETLRFLGCTFGELFEDVDVINKCINQQFETEQYELIDACARADEGEEISGRRYLRKYAEDVATLSPKVSHVPWILINNEHNLEAEANLVHELCLTYYTNDKPIACRPEKLVDVDIYYEGDSLEVGAFMATQLAQQEPHLDELGNFGFVPFGQTQLNEQGECNEDDLRCKANLIHACVVNRFYNASGVNIEPETNRIRTAGFIICSTINLQTRTDVINHTLTCFEENFMPEDIRILHECLETDQGKLALQAAEVKTALLEPALTKVPTVTINAKQSDKHQTDLFGQLCNQYGLIKPAQCGVLPTGASMVGVYYTANQAGRDFFIEQMLPLYREIVSVEKLADVESTGAKLHTILTPTLVPYGSMMFDNETNEFHCETKEECFINRVLACAAYYHEDEPRARLHLVEYTVCIFSHEKWNTDPGHAASECAGQLWLLDSYTELEVCAKGTDQASIDIALSMKRKTDLAQITTFPAVTIDYKLDEEAVNGLLGRVCDNYKGADKPSECSGTVEPIETSSKPSGFAFSRHALSIELLVVLFIISFLAVLN